MIENAKPECTDKGGWSRRAASSVVALLSVSALLAVVMSCKNRLWGPEPDCQAWMAKACKTADDCELARVAPCKMESFAEDYADACAKDISKRCDYLDWDNVHATCEAGKCVVRPGF